MPHTTTWEKDGIYWKAYGTVTEQEIYDGDAELFNDPRSDRIKDWIYDGTEVEAFIMPGIHTELIAGSDSAASDIIPNVKAAFIATNDDAIKIIKLYISVSMEFGTTWKFKIFENLKSARLWVSS